MPKARDKSMGDLVKELKPVEIWKILGALFGVVSAVFLGGFWFSDHLSKSKIENLEKHIERLEKYDIPSLSEGKLAVPCPRVQYEIVKLYQEFGAAVRSSDKNKMLEFYSEKYDNKGQSREEVVRLFAPLLGKNIMFLVSSLRHRDAEKVVANVTGVVPPDGAMENLNVLIYEESRWRFLN